MNNMKSTLLSAALVSTVALSSTAMAAMTFTDSTNDLFDNGMSNLDITSVNVWDDAENLYFSVTTASFSDWTKYCIFGGDSTSTSTATTNPWGRPHDQNGTGTNSFIGSWVNQSSNNSQAWGWHAPSSTWEVAMMFSNSVSGNTVTWTIAGAGSNNNAGYSFHFDVGTTGGGNDPFIDLLSRSDQSTSGWGTASVAGTFANYTVTPAPGAIALLGLAGLVSRRRR